MNNNSDLKNLNIDQLYELIGESLNTKAFGANSPEEKLELGKTWFKFVEDKLRNVICSNKHIMELTQDPSKEDLLVQALTDLICSILFSVPCATIAYLILNIGITKFCSVEPVVNRVDDPIRIN